MPMLPASLFMANQGYSITRSLRFNSADTAYLSRTFATPTSARICTFSAWVKRGNLSGPQTLIGGGSGTSVDCLHFAGATSGAGDSLTFRDTGGGAYDVVSSGVYRDPAAWYHVVVAFDTTQATAANRVKMYINGTQLTTTGTQPSQNTNLQLNSANAHAIGRRAGNSSMYFDGYMVDIYFIDGTALTPSSFGETSSTTGQWIAKRATGITYGANGFYLPFSDNSNTTATTLGKDFSGNGNNFTPNNFSVTAGAGNDSLTDTPTNNYPTLNPIWKNSNATQSNGNLTATTTTTGSETNVIATVPFPTSGKWVMEVTPNAGTFSGNAGPGIVPTDVVITANTRPGFFTNGIGYLSGGTKDVNGVNSAYGSSWTTNDVLRIEVDMDGQTVQFFKNGTGQGTIALTAGVQYVFAFDLRASSGTPGIDVNFGQRAFAGTPSTGFSALCTSNLATPTIIKPGQQFNVALYTGNGTAIGSGGNAITGTGFSPNFVWIKGISGATDHALYDTVRGATKQLESNNANAETTEAQGLTTFGSDGFTVGSLAQVNTSTATYVAWQWREGTTPGFDIVTDTKSSSSQTFSHSLGVTPHFFIVKSIGSGAGNGLVYHRNAASSPQNGGLVLELTSAFTSNAGYWNNTAPTSTQFTVGSFMPNATMVAWLWTEVAGFSRIGAWTGNASSDGPFVYCGFRPKYVILKNVADGTTAWSIIDAARSTTNVAQARLSAESNAAQDTLTNMFDFLSNGFKIRVNNSNNASGQTIVFAAFAEYPFKYANAR